MKKIEKALLGIVTMVCPVVLAACYGPMYQPVSGKVMDRETKAGIANIELACRAGDVGKGDSVRSRNDGSFTLSGRYCETIEVRDVDGQENGGLYADQTVSVPDPGSALSVELVKKAP